MAHNAFIFGKSASLLWGTTSSLRLKRQLKSLGVTSVFFDAVAPSKEAGSIVINGAYVFDSNILKEMISCDQACAIINDKKVIAVKGGSDSSCHYLDYLDKHQSVLPSKFELISPPTSSTYNDHLRRKEPPLVSLVNMTNAKEIEARLYGNSYKGITDFVTKWLWPTPAKKVVRILATHHISPNSVTLFSLFLVITSAILFGEGYFLSGLVLAWIMTFLDTVDGKLARVTVTSSRTGHILDHGMDIIHPPIWYACWANGLLTTSQIDAETAEILNFLIVWGYVFGRIIEALFHTLGNCSIFAWRPFDAFCRLFTARRNPCLILLSVGFIATSPEFGLYAVCGWTLLSSFILGIRFVQAVFFRIYNGPLESWLKDEENAMKNYPIFYDMFSNTRKAYE